MGRPYKCPHCREGKSIWKGYRPLKDGKVRLRQCKVCGRKFVTSKTTAGVGVRCDEYGIHEA